MPAVPRRADGVIWDDLDGHIVVFNPATKHAVALNETAAAIWLLIDGIRDEAAIAAELCARYDVDALEAHNAVAMTIAQFAGEKLLDDAGTPDEGAAGPPGRDT